MARVQTLRSLVSQLPLTTAYLINDLLYEGSAIYLYGTKGPSHVSKKLSLKPPALLTWVQANYSVQFDNLIIFLSANAPETLYQQPLFAFKFSTTGSHFISLTSHSVPGGSWLDLDYVTITVNDTEVYVYFASHWTPSIMKKR